MNEHRVDDPVRFSGERILIVDDEKLIVEMLKDALSDDNLGIETALSAESAFTRMKKVDFDVVMTDIHLPGFSGLELLKQIKERSPRTEVIVFTGYATIETAIEALDEGAMCYLTKPIRIQTVREKIWEAVEKRRKFEALLKDEKLSTLEYAIGLIRHEIINETQAILGCVEYLLSDSDARFRTERTDDSVDIIDQIKSSVFRINNTVNQLEKIKSEIRTTVYVGDTKIIDLDKSS
jgi:YesN/AraC family two-component response regulator